MITQERVRELFEYRDGKLYWIDPRTRGAKRGDRAGRIIGPRPYQYIIIDGEREYEHRLIFLMFRGYLPKQVDHVSDELTEEGIKSNRIENLRDATQSQNLQKKRSKTNGRSKYRGVWLKKKNQRWRACIKINKQSNHLGTFINEIDAAKAYDKAAIEYYGQHCFTNFPIS